MLAVLSQARTFRTSPSGTSCIKPPMPFLPPSLPKLPGMKKGCWPHISVQVCNNGIPTTPTMLSWTLEAVSIRATCFKGNVAANVLGLTRFNFRKPVPQNATKAAKSRHALQLRLGPITAFSLMLFYDHASRKQEAGLQSLTHASDR